MTTYPTTSPSPDELRALRHAMGWSASQAATAFGGATGRQWRLWESGARTMEAGRWALGLLLIGRHQTMELSSRL